MKSRSLDFNTTRETDRIVSFIRRVTESSGAKGVVVALSGGIDSAVVGALCVKALGKTRVFGLLLPSDHTPVKDTNDAESLAKTWGIKCSTIMISDIVNSMILSAKIKGTKIARANIEARTRMIFLYYHANSFGYLVAGTGDRSEYLEGYSTKFGDGGVDFLPIVHLYKTQVRELGASLGLPRAVVNKPASPQLWPGQKASDELPEEYAKLDVVLHSLFDLREGPNTASAAANVPVEVAERAIKMHLASEHKRRLPESLARKGPNRLISTKD